MNNLASRVQQRMEALGLSQDDLAKQLKVTQTAVYKVVADKTKAPKNILAYAKVLQCDANWLSTGIEPRIIEGQVIREAPPRYSNVEPYEPKTHERVPLINEVQAGLWCEAVEKYQPGDAETWELCPIDHSPFTFALRVNGNSMTNPIPGEDTFRHGDIVFIDPERAISSGDYVVAKLLSNHNATFKQYIEDAGRRWLMPLNPRYEKIEYVEGMHICGRLIYHGKRY